MKRERSAFVFGVDQKLRTRVAFLPQALYAFMASSRSHKDRFTSEVWIYTQKKITVKLNLSSRSSEILRYLSVKWHSPTLLVRGRSDENCEDNRCHGIIVKRAYKWVTMSYN